MFGGLFCGQVPDQVVVQVAGCGCWLSRAHTHHLDASMHTQQRAGQHCCRSRWASRRSSSRASQAVGEVLWAQAPRWLRCGAPCLAEVAACAAQLPGSPAHVGGFCGTGVPALVCLCPAGSRMWSDPRPMPSPMQSCGGT
jgi:hypothetical protein